MHPFNLVEPKFMKATFDLPEELIREVKLHAVLQRRTMTDLVADFLRQGLRMASLEPAEQPSARSILEMSDQGLPVIRCLSNAPATRMSVEELLKLEQEIQTKEDAQHAGIAP